MITVAASDLLKKSAKQILYLRLHPEKSATTSLHTQGSILQKANTTSRFQEMRGCYCDDTTKIFYSIDEVHNNFNSATLIEHKAILIDSGTEKYLERSILQAGAYHSLAEIGDRKLTTATFYVAQGNPKQSLNLSNKNLTSKLLFGDRRFTILVRDEREVVKLLVGKAQATTNWDTVKNFSEDEFTHKLKKYIFAVEGKVV